MLSPIANLGSRASAVVDEGRRALRPPVGERERLEALLELRLSGSAPYPIAEASVSSATGRWPLAVALGLGFVVAGSVLGSRAEPAEVAPSSVAPTRQTQVPNTAAPAPPTEVAPLPVPVPVPESPSVARLAAEQPSARRAPDGLAEEVALLTEATSDLRAGRAAQALKSLDEHQRRFPDGVLAIERSAVRAQTLCSLKRVSEGRAELARLAQQSPAAGRAKQVCDRSAASELDK